MTSSSDSGLPQIAQLRKLRRHHFNTYNYQSKSRRDCINRNQSSNRITRVAGVPAGYSTKHWDSDGLPLIVLGSVFDPNSMGKWIFDWTVWYHGSRSPDLAGYLWPLLIRVAANIQLGEQWLFCLSELGNESNKTLMDMTEDFLPSGYKLWSRFTALLTICAEYMWKSAKIESRDKEPVTVGKNEAIEFIEVIFGQDRESQHTEQLMIDMEAWYLRFEDYYMHDDLFKFTSWSTIARYKRKLRIQEIAAYDHIESRWNGSKTLRWVPTIFIENQSRRNWN